MRYAPVLSNASISVSSSCAVLRASTHSLDACRSGPQRSASQVYRTTKKNGMDLGYTRKSGVDRKSGEADEGSEAPAERHAKRVSPVAAKVKLLAIAARADDPPKLKDV